MINILSLSNDKKVANFSSPHAFTFEDGFVLQAQPNWVAEKLKVTFNESLDDDGDVTLSFTLSDGVMDQMIIWMDYYTRNMIDVVFCPLPMITAIKEMLTNNQELPFGSLKHSPFRAIRVTDRITKKISISKQCI